MRLLNFFFLAIILFGCTNPGKPTAQSIKVDEHWLDSIKKKSDTTWVKPYRSEDFKTAEYYVDRKDSIVTQVMKDTTGTIRQIIIAKYDNIRRFFAQYYANGQLMAALKFDTLGKYDGEAQLYFENGMLKSKGSYQHGFYTGQWKNYDSTGKFISTDNYDANGQLIK